MEEARLSILQRADNLINGQRKLDYGSPSQSFSQIAELWGAYLRRTYPSLKLVPQDVINMMILLKVSRAQQSYHEDSYIDIAGYVGCAELIDNNVKSEGFEALMKGYEK